MNGLDLEPFLRLVRADLGVWITLATIVGLVAVMTWTSWGSRRALRKCLVLSILAHAGLLLYGYRNGLAREGQPGGIEDGGHERIRDIQVLPVADVSREKGSGEGRPAGKFAEWDRPRSTPPEMPLLPDRPAAPKEVATREIPEPLAPPPASPPDLQTPDLARPELVEPSKVELAEAAPARSEELPSVEIPTKPTDPAGEIVRIRPRRDPTVEPIRPRPRPVERSEIPPPGLPEIALNDLPNPPEMGDSARLAVPRTSRGTEGHRLGTASAS